jgi:adenosylmethionine-8-amino-7-oxononanoate aminotransferase
MRRPNPEELAAWDHAYLWHPFTQMQEWLAQPPLIIESGSGPYLTDVHGHRHPKLDAALQAQLQQIAHSTLLGLGGVPSIVLAKRLVEITPANLTRVFYSDAGATAVEIALKLAFQYWQLRGESRRTQFASLTEAYHGDTIGAVSLGYSEAFHRYYKPLLFPCHKLNPPHVFRWQKALAADAALDAALSEAEAFFAEHGAELAAIIVEPLMQGAAGMWAHPVAYLRRLRELSQAHGVLMICDEVATGFGRTGRMFAVEHAHIEPDLMCVGKGITGGYLPLAATFASEEIFSTFLAPYADFKAFFHGHTYTGNALACAVALASLDVFEADNVLANTQARSLQLEMRLRDQIEPLAHVGDVRQWGLMAGIELVRDRKNRGGYPSEERLGMQVAYEARKRGVILRPLGNVMILMPPLCLSEEQLDELCTVTAQAIRTVTER